MEDSEIIISGPELTGPEYWGSVAEYLIPRMKAQPKDFVIQVDCATNETITSYDFLQQSLEIAEGIIQFGLKPADVVIFLGPNNIRSHVTAIGIILSGGIFAPIDHSLRPFELQHFFKEFKPKFIICEKEKTKEVQSCIREIDIDPKIILIDSTVPEGEFYSWEDIRTSVDVVNYVPRGVADPKKCICVINCSSGTTGMPKGVAISHYAVLASFSLAENRTMREVSENFLLTSPLFWISGTVLLLNSSYFGQTRYIPKSTAPEDVLEGIQRCKPFFLLMGPASLLDLVTHENFKKYDVSSVRNLFSAGGALNMAIRTKVKDTWGGVAVSNYYGLTEATGGVTVAYNNETPTAIGRVVAGVQVKVVDIDTGKCLGPSKVGEIRIKTNRLMNGYYNNEKATKASFDDNGWLRTGDLVYYDEDHVFYFVRRVQEVIQYLVYKISPIEIEAFIIGLPGVKDVAVVGVPHEIDTNHLRALVVKDPKSDISADDIIKKVEENFSERKRLRAGVQFVAALPRTGVGKLRRLEVQKLIQKRE